MEGVRSGDIWGYVYRKGLTVTDQEGIFWGDVSFMFWFGWWSHNNIRFSWITDLYNDKVHILLNVNHTSIKVITFFRQKKKKKKERILEWVAMPFSRGSSQPRAQTQVSHIAGRLFTDWAPREAIWQKPTHYCKAIILQLKKNGHIISFCNKTDNNWSKVQEK